MKCSCPTYKCSYSTGRQQQQCQSPPQRGPTQSEVHSWTPFRCPSRHVSPWLILPCSQLRDEQLHHSSSFPQLQLHQQESPGKGVTPTWLGIALMHTKRPSLSPQKSTVVCLPKSPAQKLLQFDPISQDDLGDSPSYQLTWLASSNGLKVPLMSNVMLRDCLPLQSHALQQDPRWPCQRGRMTNSTLQLPREPHLGLAAPHLPGLQLWRTPSCTAQCGPQSNGWGSGSGHTLKGWGHHPIGGLISSLWTRGAWERSNSSRSRDRLQVSDFPQLNLKKNPGWWDPPPSLHNLHCDKFMPPGDLRGSQDIQETSNERTLTLAKALQSCAKRSSGPYYIMCGTARDLQECMTNLMWFTEEDILDAMLMEPVGN